MSHQEKCKVIRAKCHPKALYGCEASAVDDEILRRYRTACVNTLEFHTNMRSVDLTFATCSHGIDLDPYGQILIKRAVAVRRGVAKRPKLGAIVSRVLERYTVKGLLAAAPRTKHMLRTAKLHHHQAKPTEADG